MAETKMVRDWYQYLLWDNIVKLDRDYIPISGEIYMWELNLILI